MSEPRRPTSRWIGVLALVPTPLLVLVSPALQLYLRNQEDLYYQSSVVTPFVGLSLVVVGVGAALWGLSKIPFFRFFTWAYLLFAVFFLAYRFLGGAVAELPSLLGLAVSWSVESAWGLALWCAAWLTVSYVAARRFAPRSVANAMAVFGLVLLAGDGFTLVRAMGSARGDGGSALRAAGAPPTTESMNVYHIVLDAFQTEVLELLRSPELDAELGGFVYFPANRAIYHSTVMSLGSTFSSRRYAYDEPRARYIEAGFHERSMMLRFADADYWTLAIVPSSDPIETGASGFRDVFLHANNFERSSTMNNAAFKNLWIVANVPAVLLDWIASSGWLDERTVGELRLTRAGRALTDSAPVASAMSFRELIAAEQRLPDTGRYTFVHLLIPHSPYLLREDCSFEEWERAPDPLAQTTCTLALLNQFLGELDSLERFEDSLIIVHGDHGEPLRVQSGQLVPARARTLTTPLLVKPPRRARGERLAICDTSSSLLDIAPTVLDFVGLAPAPSFEGTTLRPELESCY